MKNLQNLPPRIKRGPLSQWFVDKFLQPRLTQQIYLKQKEQREQLIEKFQLSHEAQNLTTTLLANGFKGAGIHYLDGSVIKTFISATEMIWLQCGFDGKIQKVYKEVNENNLDILLGRLLNKTDNVADAVKLTQAALFAINKEYPLITQGKNPMPDYLEMVQGWLQSVVNYLREIKK